MASATTTLRALELAEFEKIVPRGVQKQTWSVRVNGGWVLAPKVPGAVVVEGPSQPGLVWQRVVRLELQPGTHLRLTTESPQPAKPRDVFSVITVDARSTTRVRRQEFCITRDGKLQRPSSE